MFHPSHTTMYQRLSPIMHILNRHLRLSTFVQAQRLFRDRLVDSDSRTRFDGMLNAQLRSVWGHTTDLTGVRCGRIPPSPCVSILGVSSVLPCTVSRISNIGQVAFTHSGKLARRKTIVTAAC